MISKKMHDSKHRIISRFYPDEGSAISLTKKRWQGECYRAMGNQVQLVINKTGTNMKSFKYLFAVTVLTSALTLSASATFIIDPDPGGEKLFIDVANKDVSDFQGFVGANNSSAPHVGIHTTGNVNTGSGFANLKPVKNGSPTELTFTPE